MQPYAYQRRPDPSIQPLPPAAGASNGRLPRTTFHLREYSNAGGVPIQSSPSRTPRSSDSLPYSDPSIPSDEMIRSFFSTATTHKDAFAAIHSLRATDADFAAVGQGIMRHREPQWPAMFYIQVAKKTANVVQGTLVRWFQRWRGQVRDVEVNFPGPCSPEGLERLKNAAYTQHIPFLVPFAAWNTGFVPSWRDHAVNYVGNYPESWGYVTRADGTQVWTNASVAGGEFDGNDMVVEPLMASPPPFGTIVPSSSSTYSSQPPGTMPSMAFEQAYPTAPYQFAQHPAQPSSTYSPPSPTGTMSSMHSIASQYAVQPTPHQTPPIAQGGQSVMPPYQFAQRRAPSSMSTYSPTSPPDTMSSIRSVASQHTRQIAQQPQPPAPNGPSVMAPPQFAQHRTPSPPSYPSLPSGTMPSANLVASQNGAQQIVHQTQAAYGMAPPQFAQHRTPSPPSYPSLPSGTMPSANLVASQNGAQQIVHQTQAAYGMAPGQFAQHSSYYPTLPPNHLPPGPEDPSLTTSLATSSTAGGSFVSDLAPPLTTSYAGPIASGPVLPVLPAATQITAPPQALPNHEPDQTPQPTYIDQIRKLELEIELENKKIEADHRRTVEMKQRIKIKNSKLNHPYAPTTSSLSRRRRLAGSRSSTASNSYHSSSSLGSLDMARLNTHSSDSLIVTGSDQVILAGDRDATSANAPSNGHVHSGDAHVVAGNGSDQNRNGYLQAHGQSIGGYEQNGGGYEQNGGGYGQTGGGYDQGTGAHNQTGGGSVQNGGGYGQTGGGYGQTGGGFVQNGGGYDQGTGAHNQTGGGYDQGTGAHNQTGGGYDQGTGAHNQTGGGYDQGTGAHNQTGGGYDQGTGAHNQAGGGSVQNGGGYGQTGGGYDQGTGAHNQIGGGYSQTGGGYDQGTGAHNQTGGGSVQNGGGYGQMRGQAGDGYDEGTGAYDQNGDRSVQNGDKPVQNGGGYDQGMGAHNQTGGGSVQNGGGYGQMRGQVGDGYDEGTGAYDQADNGHEYHHPNIRTTNEHAPDGTGYRSVDVDRRSVNANDEGTDGNGEGMAMYVHTNVSQAAGGV